MGFRNPITGLPASAIQDGVLSAGVIAQRIRTGVDPAKHWDIGSVPINHITGYDGVAGDAPGFIEIDVIDAGGGVVNTPTVKVSSGSAPLTNPASITIQGEVPTAANPAISSKITATASELVAPGYHGFTDVLGVHVALSAVDAKLNSLSLLTGVVGVASVTTDAGGNFTITHGVGNASHVIYLISNQASAITFQLTGRTANDSSLRAYKGTVVVATATFSVFYIVCPYTP